MTFSSMVNGPMLGMFIIGGISKHANYKVIIGITCQFIISECDTIDVMHKFNLGKLIIY